MSEHELLSPDNSGSGWDNVVLAKKVISGVVAIRMSWYSFFEKINSRGGASIPDWKVASLTCNAVFTDVQSWTKITGHLLIFPSSPLSPKINVVIAEKSHDRCKEEKPFP